MSEEKSRIGRIMMSLILVSALTACGMQPQKVPETQSTEAVETPAEPEKEEVSAAEPEEKKEVEEMPVTYARPVLFTPEALAEGEDLAFTASVPAYQVEPDLSNVINAKDESFFYDPPQSFIDQLARDGFYVQDNGGREFYETYEWNRYSLTPNFVTVDSLMHSYHLYFAYLMKTIEREELCDRLVSLTDRMLENSEKQRMEMYLSSTINEVSKKMNTAADRNIAFFAVAKALLDPSWDPASDEQIAASKEVLDTIKAELALIDAAAGIDISPLSGEEAQMEDYSQYKPRGYYDTDERLSRYFRAMMWYGRRNFPQNEVTQDMSALLMTLTVDARAMEDWSAIYAVTSFFAGASDDNGICEYGPLLEEAYGAPVSELANQIPMIVSSEKGWETFHALTEKLDPPAINSVPMWDDNGETDKAEVNQGFRFMGQRFSLDAAIFQKLIYSNVKMNSAGENRMLPEALDVPAVLGSEEAEKLLKDMGAFDYEKYEENFRDLKEQIGKAPAETWENSLYAGWLNTLRPLLAEKGEGYPQFMQNERWTRKDLECFLGSYTELKHDTVLYSKQVMAEMGGADFEDRDDRGYVEPEPVVYARFEKLAGNTAEGLKRFGLLSDNAARDLGRLSDIAHSLYTISVKELQNELPSVQEFELIRSYGGEIEHFWQEAYREEAENPDYYTSEEFPAALVTDIATDPNGSVLQVGTDSPAQIVVIVPVDGSLRLARGSVYSFYQFVNPIDKRMTDSEWRIKLGIDEDENGEYHWEREDVPEKPAWTTDYRVRYEWE